MSTVVGVNSLGSAETVRQAQDGALGYLSDIRGVQLKTLERWLQSII